MSSWLTVSDFKTLTTIADVTPYEDDRLEGWIDRATSMARALGLDTSRTGFTDVVKHVLIEAVEAMIELNRPHRSRTTGRRSVTYDRNAVRKILKEGLAEYIVSPGVGRVTR